MPKHLDEEEKLVGTLEVGEWCMSRGGFVGLVVDTLDGVAGHTVLSGCSTQLTENLFGGTHSDGVFRLTAWRCPGETLVRRCEPFDIELVEQ